LGDGEKEGQQKKSKLFSHFFGGKLTQKREKKRVLPEKKKMEEEVTWGGWGPIPLGTARKSAWNNRGNGEGNE